MKTHGWTILFHECLIEQVQPLRAAILRAERKDPGRAAENSDAKFIRHLISLMRDIVPLNPAGPQYLQGNTLGGLTGIGGG